MHFNIVTLFPEYFSGPLDCGQLGKARESGLLSFSFHSPRDAAEDKRRTVDGPPYGGGPGMVMLPGPLSRTLRGLGFIPRSAGGPGPLLLFKAGGIPFGQTRAAALAEEADRSGRDRTLTLICGRYEGIDARIEELFPAQPVSVGDFVLNGGEAAALCLIEAVSRLLPGFMGDERSREEESFTPGLCGGLPEYPQYTRPEVFEGLAVPKVLLSGDHAGIALWRRQASLLAALQIRPELAAAAALDHDDRAWLQSVCRPATGRNLYCALVHFPVLDREDNPGAASLTNLDIHDIARSSCTYGLGGFYALTPLADQRALLRDILRYWTAGPGARSNPDRARALALVREGEDIACAVADLELRTGTAPLLIGTSARSGHGGPPEMTFAEIAGYLQTRPVLLLFGTGRGLAPQALEMCAAVAPPLRALGAYNHLSVRAAAAVTFDRILHDLD
ncbi:MAG: tRNA (guanosine(37)-N1)-methyltransferase TrmD [Desulfovibrio sp.]|jgi:tRNA (guanine37-N1)-methyltransferase|nr:tRNA (guanosine(37)-N1)-methyltransferase TrmD [Desulfovibrio sp.]